MSNKRCVVVIPARLASSRFPKKILTDLLGKPLIQHTYENAAKAKKVSDVYIAVDDEEVKNRVQDFGAKAILTPQDIPSGTDRVAYCLGRLSADFVINLQADEPMILPQHLDLMAETLQKKDDSMVTLVERKENFDDYLDPNVVKVVLDQNGRALYFSRSPLPYYRNEDGKKYWYKHVGVYGYKTDFLLQLAQWPKTELEMAESLEQLRVLENGFSIQTLRIEEETIGVDAPEDLEKVRSKLCDDKSS